MKSLFTKFPPCIKPAPAMLLFLLLFIMGSCASGPGGDLNQTATLEELEARIETLEKKVNRAIQQSATAKIDATTALVIANNQREREREKKREAERVKE